MIFAMEKEIRFDQFNYFNDLEKIRSDQSGMILIVLIQGSFN